MRAPSRLLTWVPKTIRLALTPVLLLSGFAFSRAAPSGGVALPPRTAAPAPSPSLGSVLKPDGTLNLPPGFSGRLYARGWTLVSGDGQAPRFAALAPGDERWTPGYHPDGVNGTVLAMVVDGSGNTYVAGSFNMAGALPVRNIAKWDGSQWSALGYGLDGTVDALVWDSSHHWLYAGGEFNAICMNPDCTARDPSRTVARWDPSGAGAWHALAYGLAGQVYALALDSTGNLYAGGYISGICTATSCSTVSPPVNNIARWNPAGSGTWTDWSALATAGGVGVNASVWALAWWNAPFPVGSVLVAGGDFTAAGGLPMNRLSIWSPPAGAGNGTWSSFWSGVDGPVYALAVEPTTGSVVVGGSFFDICGNAPPGCGTPTLVNHLALAVGLSYWGGMNHGVSGVVSSLSVDSVHKQVYAGGGFDGYCTDVTCSGVIPASNIARWDYSQPTSSWSALGTGTDSQAYAVVWNSAANRLFAGGDFVEAGGGAVSGLATWDGSAWSQVGTGNGVGPQVNAVAADGRGHVYLGGGFRSVGHQFVNRIALWNSQTGAWSALGYGLYGDVEALALDPAGNLYVAGNFSNLCGNLDCTSLGTQVNGIARWTPSGNSGTWSAVGWGLGGEVHALAWDQHYNLYAGGNFRGVCEDVGCSFGSRSPAQGVAVWNGSQWSPLAFGLDGAVQALAVDQNDTLFAGGDFGSLCADAACTTGGARVNNIAQWTPGAGGGAGAWSPVGNGVDNVVYALVVDRNNTLYAGGQFTHLCGAPACTGDQPAAFGIARWNGSWSPVGYGLNGSVAALAVDERNHLYAAGSYQFLCGDPGCFSNGAEVNNIARWDGNAWSALGSGIGPPTNSNVSSLASSNGTLTVGGYFSTAGDQAAANFARYTYGAYIFLPTVVR